MMRKGVMVFVLLCSLYFLNFPMVFCINDMNNLLKRLETKVKEPIAEETMNGLNHACSQKAHSE